MASWGIARRVALKRSPLKRASKPIQRTQVKKRRSGPPRRGRRVDRDYMAWLATQPPLVSGPGRITIHHVRRFGEQKDDRRTVPLPASLHLIQDGPHSSIEALGKRAFQQRYGVDLEVAIVKYNERFEQEMGHESETIAAANVA
jgi:hypothetical protein